MMKADSFQVLEYIRASIEIIMNIKVEDLEKDLSLLNKQQKEAEETEALNSKDGNTDKLDTEAAQKNLQALK
jgi:hypothetical protein